MPDRHYKVATFWHPPDKLIKTKVRAYTRDYNPAWEGCVCFEIDARTGEEAKAKAIQLRLELEKSKLEENPK